MLVAIEALVMQQDDMIKALNLYARLGGNRKLWKNVEVTAVEIGANSIAFF